MRVRRYKTEPSLLLEQGREIMKSSDGSLFYFLVYRPRIIYTLTVLKFELLHPHWDPHPPNAISSDTLLDQH